MLASVSSIPNVTSSPKKLGTASSAKSKMVETKEKVLIQAKQQSSCPVNSGNVLNQSQCVASQRLSPSTCVPKEESTVTVLPNDTQHKLPAESARKETDGSDLSSSSNLTTTGFEKSDKNLQVFKFEEGKLKLVDEKAKESIMVSPSTNAQKALASGDNKEINHIGEISTMFQVNRPVPKNTVNNSDHSMETPSKIMVESAHLQVEEKASSDIVEHTCLNSLESHNELGKNESCQ